MKTVTIYGGGMAGAKLAHALAGEAQVTLVSPLDYFEVPMAMPRAAIEPAVAQRAVIALAAAQPEVTHVQGRLVRFDGRVGQVETTSGETLEIQSDISVLATGSSYANDLTRAQTGTAQDRRDAFASFNTRLKQAQRILIVGGGPIGVELAGEIWTEFPQKDIHLVQSGPDILHGTSRKVAAHAKKILRKRGVVFHLGQRVIDPAYGDEPQGGIARTDTGQELPFDLIFWAVGSRPNTAYLGQDLRDDQGRVPVDHHLRVRGLDNVYALGDITDLNEVKKAIYVNSHVKIATKNIRAALKGQPPKARYKAQTDNDIMVVTLGRHGGVAHLPGLGMVRANWFIRMVKAKDMLIAMTRGHMTKSKG